jgi:hypothetical protein
MAVKKRLYPNCLTKTDGNFTYKIMTTINDNIIYPMIYLISFKPASKFNILLTSAAPIGIALALALALVLLFALALALVLALVPGIGFLIVLIVLIYILQIQ